MSADALWASLPVPGLTLDAAGAITRLNPAAEGFLNASAGRLAGRSLWAQIATDPPLHSAFRRAFDAGTTLFVDDVDVSIVGRAQTQCNLSLAPLAGQAEGMVLLIAPREMAGQAGQGRDVQAAARSAIGMAGMLAHEIRNPLAGIAGAAQLLSMNLAAEDRELTDLIVAETRRVVRLLGQVEQFGDTRPPERQAVNIHDVLDRARRSALLGFGEGMTIIAEYDPSLPPALGDSDQLLQVMLNLLRNACEAAQGEGGTIRLRTFYEHSFRLRGRGGAGPPLPLQVEVIDDGPGLPPGIRGDIFDPFVSGRENGTGLGLALVAKIVSEHGGWISVDSVPGRTAFRIALPLAQVDARGAA